MDKNYKIRQILLLLVFVFTLTGCRQAVRETDAKVSISEESLTDSKKQEQLEQKKKEEQQETLKRELGLCRDKIKAVSAFCPEDKAEEFTRWLFEGREQYVSDFSNTDTDYSLINKKIYEITGKSLIVNWDEYIKDTGVEECPDEKVIFANTTDGSVDVIFSGDICLTEDGYVIDHYDAKNQGIDGCISAGILDETRAADLFVVNHEYPSSTRGTPLSGKYYTFRANPSREQILVDMGVDLVSLSNNHIYDYGPDAFADTLDSLKAKGIAYFGAGMNFSQASAPVYFVIDGIKIGFVGANSSEKNIFTPEAGENSPGVVRMYDPERFRQIIERTADRCDYLVAYVHWGKEDSNRYLPYQTDIAKQYFDAGADVIIGSHPHVLQGIQYIDGKPVVYSLGDFWFNGETKYTMLSKIKIGIDGIKSMELIPCIQEGYETHILDGEKKKEFYEYINSLSEGCLVEENGMVRDTDSDIK